MRRELPSVVLLIDYDNLEIGASFDLPGRPLDLGSLIEVCQRYGSVTIARAYADWGDPNERLAVYESGIEPCFAPIFRAGPNEPGKSLADTVLVADGVDILWRVAPDVLVLVTSDKDILPLARLARLRGTRTVVVGSDRTALPLRRLADEYVVRPYPGRITLFRPTEAPVAAAAPPDRGWGQLAAAVDVHFVPGQHHSMVKEPHVQVLARKLHACLRAAI